MRTIYLTIAFSVAALFSQQSARAQGNTATGANALFSVTAAENSTANGESALYSLTGGGPNFGLGTATGAYSLYLNQDDYQTASGYLSLYSASTTGGSNTAIGSCSLYGSSDSSTGIGYQSLYAAQAVQNAAFGFQSLYSNTTGNYNTAAGSLSLALNATGNDNTATGYAALYKTTTANDNTATGYEALYTNTTGYNNTGTGSGALFQCYNSTSHDNTAYGYQSMHQLYLISSYNTAAGSGGGYWISGTHNTSIGYWSMHFIEGTATDCTAVGISALEGNNSSALSPSQSTNIGADTGGYGNDNVSVGYSAGNKIVSGVYNAAVGYDSMLNDTSGSQNASFGISALYSATTGGNNTAFGEGAIGGVTTGSNNIGLGWAGSSGSGANITTTNYNIDIANTASTGDANMIRIGSSTYQHKTFVSGINGVTTGGSGAVAVLVDANGQLGTVSSSRRYKEDIHGMGDASSRILDLRPVTFRYKRPYDNGEKPLQYGLIAEEVAETFPTLAVFNDQSRPETVKYQDLPVMLLNELQKAGKHAAERDHHLADLEKTVAVLKAELLKKQQHLSELDAKRRARETRMARLEQSLQQEVPVVLSAKLDTPSH